jgi:hypothetical protein
MNTRYRLSVILCRRVQWQRPWLEWWKICVGVGKSGTIVLTLFFAYLETIDGCSGG